MADAAVRKLQDRITWSDGTEQVSAGLTSKPPSGKYRVVNFYVDPVTGKLVVEYEDTPVP